MFERFHVCILLKTLLFMNGRYLMQFYCHALCPSFMPDLALYSCKIEVLLYNGGWTFTQI